LVAICVKNPLFTFSLRIFFKVWQLFNR
jgi:hypothetical protein